MLGCDVTQLSPMVEVLVLVLWCDIIHLCPSVTAKWRAREWGTGLSCVATALSPMGARVSWETPRLRILTLNHQSAVRVSGSWCLNMRVTSHSPGGGVTLTAESPPPLCIAVHICDCGWDAASRPDEAQRGAARLSAAEKKTKRNRFIFRGGALAARPV